MLAPGTRALLFAIGAAVVFVIIADTVASVAGADVNWLVSIGTAVVVGGFLALLLLRPKKPNDGFSQDEAFTVEER